MDGVRRQDSLGVSSSVAESVLTPAALHLRVSSQCRGGEGWWGGGRAAGWRVAGEGCGGVGWGARAKMSQTSLLVQ